VVTPDAEIRFLDALYRADDYLPIIAADGDTASTLLVIGHNPSIHRTALSLAPDLSGRSGRSLSASFPTSAVAVFDHIDAWPTIRPGSADFREFILPEGRAD
jgi:phosphohistidine phosphatase